MVCSKICNRHCTLYSSTQDWYFCKKFYRRALPPRNNFIKVNKVSHLTFAWPFKSFHCFTPCKAPKVKSAFLTNFRLQFLTTKLYLNCQLHSICIYLATCQDGSTFGITKIEALLKLFTAFPTTNFKPICSGATVPLKFCKIASCSESGPSKIRYFEPNIGRNKIEAYLLPNFCK